MTEIGPKSNVGITSVLRRYCVGVCIGVFAATSANANAVWEAFSSRCLDAVVAKGEADTAGLTEVTPNVLPAILGEAGHYDVFAYDLGNGLEMAVLGAPGKRLHGCAVATLQSKATAAGVAAFDTWISSELAADRWRESSGMLGPVYLRKWGGPIKLQLGILANDGAMVISLDHVKVGN